MHADPGNGRRPPRRKRTPRRRLLAWDRVWVRRWRNFQPPSWLHRFLVLFVRLGDGWGWVAVAAVFAALLPPDRFALLAVQSLFAVAVSIPLYWILKLSFRRTRPYRLLRWVTAKVPPLDTYSFPSGHTMNNMAVAASLAFHLPWLWPLALAVPVTLGLLRVLYGVHFLSDIAAGALFGLAAALLAWKLHALALPFLAFF